MEKQQRRFTVLTRQQSWLPEEKLKLLKLLPNCETVSNDFFRPNILFVYGEHDKATVATILGNNNFALQIVNGAESSI